MQLIGVEKDVFQKVSFCIGSGWEDWFLIKYETSSFVCLISSLLSVVRVDNLLSKISDCFIQITKMEIKSGRFFCHVLSQ